MIRAHLGIRFAAPPTGDRRWRPPEEVRDETATGTWADDCPQPATATATRANAQSEDCLFLNVWAPHDADGLPVLVWFYGGSFLFGSASSPLTDGAALAARGCVVVSAAYRVGLLGYLAHPALTAESPHRSSGNYGLLDNVAALHWVRDSISAFGGDPHRITAFGVSAGSASLALLQTSPLAVGAFDQLILQSPGAFRPLATLQTAEAAGEAAYGADITPLRRWHDRELVHHAAALTPAMRSLTSPRLLRPIRDGWIVPTNDRDAYRSGSIHAVPTIVGGNLDEGTSLTATWPIETVSQYRQLLVDNFGTLAREAEEHYPVAGDADVRSAVAALFGDTQFGLGARGIATAVAAQQPKTWRYLYTWRSNGQPDGPHHGDEVAGLFSRQAPAGEQMSDAWLRFASSGDPNQPDDHQWPPYDPAADDTFEFGDRLAVTSRWRQAQLDFLDDFYEGR